MSSSQKATLSVVLPLSNREKDVLNVIEDIHKTVTTRVPGSEIVAVDDQSRDHTWAVLRELTSGYEELRIYRLREPGGPGACSSRGFLEAKGKLLFHLEPHCPWSAACFWEMFTRRNELGGGPIFAARGSGLKRLTERASDRLFRDTALEDWKFPVPDAGFPAQLFSKADFESVHVMLPEDAVAPGLYLYLLYMFFNKPVELVTPKAPLRTDGDNRPMPDLLASVGSFRKAVEQLGRLRRNLTRIQGLVAL